MNHASCWTLRAHPQDRHERDWYKTNEYSFWIRDKEDLPNRMKRALEHAIAQSGGRQTTEPF